MLSACDCAPWQRAKKQKPRAALWVWTSFLVSPIRWCTLLVRCYCPSTLASSFARIWSKLLRNWRYSCDWMGTKQLFARVKTKLMAAHPVFVAWSWTCAEMFKTCLNTPRFTHEFELLCSKSNQWNDWCPACVERPHPGTRIARSSTTTQCMMNYQSMESQQPETNMSQSMLHLPMCCFRALKASRHVITM